MVKATRQKRVTGSNEPEPSSLDGRTLLAAAWLVLKWLRRNRIALNSRNVYPVPDGDTGDNMCFTMRAAVSTAYQVRSDKAGVVAAALAYGALMGACGNSGNILASILEGFAENFAGKERVTAEDFATALELGTTVAYARVSDPVEGTILTVLREAAAAARIWARKPGNLIALEEAVKAAYAAVQKTPSLLPELQVAGVVDAGGQGLYIMLEGALAALRLLSIRSLGGLVPLPVQPGDVLAEVQRQHEAAGITSGLCVNFLILGASLGAEAVTRYLLTLGDSVVVGGDEKVLRVHVHTKSPEDAVAYGWSVGQQVCEVVVSETRPPMGEVAQRAPRVEELGSIGVVAVAPSKGWEEVFLGLGVTAVVPGGGTMRPNVGQLLAAVDSCDQEAVLLLTNSRDVVMTAVRAAEKSPKSVAVVPTDSLPGGVAALIAFDPSVGLDENKACMEQASHQVRTGEVTRATRPMKVTDPVSGEWELRVGQPIALLDGKLVAAEDSVEGVVFAFLTRAITPQFTLVTLYYGEGVREEEAYALADRIKVKYRSLEDVPVVDGGQPRLYIISVE